MQMIITILLLLLQLVDRNYEILKQVIGEMQPIQKDAVMLLVSNPVDVLTAIAQKLAGLPKNRVFGSGTFLDSSRLNVYLSDKLNVNNNHNPAAA